MRQKVKEFIRRHEILEWIVIVSFFCLCLFILIGCATSQPPQVETGVPETAKEALGRVVYKTNWLVLFSGFGVFGSILAMGVGFRKLGVAALVASIGSAVYTVTIVRYAWLMAIGGLLIGGLLIFQTWKKNRQTIFGFVDGFQDVKKTLPIEAGQIDIPVQKQWLNEAMKRNLSAEAEKLVQKRKTQLKKQNQGGKKV